MKNYWKFLRDRRFILVLVLVAFPMGILTGLLYESLGAGLAYSTGVGLWLAISLLATTFIPVSGLEEEGELLRILVDSVFSGDFPDEIGEALVGKVFYLKKGVKAGTYFKVLCGEIARVMREKGDDSADYWEQYNPEQSVNFPLKNCSLT